MTEARINARLDASAVRKLEALKRRTGRSTSEIIRVALDQLFEKGFPSPAGAEAILRASGFVACAKGPEDLSTDYKRALSTSLRRKSS